MYYHINTTTVSSHISAAELGIFIRRYGPSCSFHRGRPRPIGSAEIVVYRVGSARFRGMQHSLERIAGKRFRLCWSATAMWYMFDITTVVDQWIDDPESNYGLKITAFDPNGFQLAVVSLTQELENRYLPYLELTTVRQSRIVSRPLRSLDCHETNAEHRCCRHPLEIEFQALRLDFVIAPTSYRAYFCSGTCPYLYATQHVHGHLLQQTDPAPSRFHGLCCASTSFAPLDILYFNDEGNVIRKTVPDMIVTGCGCA